MQKLIVLGGNSSKNLEWGAAVGAKYGPLFDEVYVQQYEHWETGEELIDFPREIEKLRDVITTDGLETEYVVMAKSFGTVLTLLAAAQGALEPVKCIFFGMPLNVVEEQELFAGDWSVLSDFIVPTLAIHSTDDPVADIAFLKTALEKYQPETITLRELPGDTHGYTDLESYDLCIREFLRH